MNWVKSQQRAKNIAANTTAHINNEAALVKQGLITREAMKNRQYLFHLMDRVDLRPIRKEWWHFQERNSIREVREQNRLLDF